MNLEIAIKSLDPENDEHWTQDGSPRLEILSELTGEKITRGAVTKAFPLINRDFAREKHSISEPENSEIEDAVPEPEISAIEIALDSAEARMHQARANLDKAQKEMSESHVAFEIALVEFEKRFPPESNQQKIMAYLDGQKAERARRAGLNTAAIQAVLKQAAQAPVDRAFAAKRNPYGKRPVRPIVGRQG